jgi:predicted  nucleic acid-binding Zn-ribbon protein
MNDLDLQRMKILEERVSALEHKVNSISAPILDAIESFRRDTLSLFESFSARIVADLERRFDVVDKRLDGMDKRFEKVDERFAAVDKRFDAVTERFDGIDRQFFDVGERFATVDQQFATMGKRFDSIDQRMADADARNARQFAELLSAIKAGNAQ